MRGAAGVQRAVRGRVSLCVCVCVPVCVLVCVLVYVLALLLLHLPQLLRVYAVHSWARLPLALLLLLQLLLACVPALLVSYLLLPMPH